MAAEQRHKYANASSSLTWRSQSAPPRKKWYRRGPSLLSRHRSTREPEPTACSMLYDQMVSRRLVGAIAAWHDLHASLLQLSLSRAQEEAGQQQQQQETAGRRKSSSKRRAREEDSSGSSFSSISRNGSRKAGSGRRHKRCSGKRQQQQQQQRGCQMQSKEKRPLGDKGDPSLNADQQQPPAVLSTTDARSRSSSVTSGAGSSSTDALRHRMDRPEVEEQAFSSRHSATPPPRPSTSSAASGPRHQTTFQGRLLQLAASKCSMTSAGACTSSRRSPTPAVEEPKSATWSATFSQSLKIRPASTRRRARSPAMGRARSPVPRAAASPARQQIIIKHSVQLLQQAGGSPHHSLMASSPLLSQPAAGWSSSQPAMPASASPSSILGLARSAGGGGQRRCFSVAKVDEAARQQRRMTMGQQQQRLDQQRCSCYWSSGDEAIGIGSGTGSELSDDEQRLLEATGDGREAEEEEEGGSGTSSGALSDSELDALYEQERSGRQKLSMSSPELTPEQLKQLFPELSEHWRWGG